MDMFAIFIAALITFSSAALLLRNASPRAMRRLLGYIGYVDLVMHAAIFALFMGNAVALIQAELAGIGISLYLRGYRRAVGYERLERRGMKLIWVRQMPQPLFGARS